MTIDLDKLEQLARAATEGIDALPSKLTAVDTPEKTAAMTAILRFAVEAPAVLELVQRLRAAEAIAYRADVWTSIVRDLATSKTTTDHPDAYCVFCRARVVEGHITHVSGCLWGRAREATKP
jgi:hypothetical protein